MLAEFFRGDTLEIFIQIADNNNTPIDLTNWEIRAHITNTAPINIKKATKNVLGGNDNQIQVLDTIGNIKIIVEKELSSTMNPGHYQIEVEITSPNGYRRTVVSDSILIKQDIINWSSI